MTQAAEPDDGRGEGGHQPARGSARVTPASAAPAPRPGRVYGAAPAPAEPERPAGTPPKPAGRAAVPAFPPASASPAPPPAAQPSPLPLSQPQPPSPPSPSPSPPSPSPSPQPKRWRRRLFAVLLPAVLLMAALGAGTAAQLQRALPAATLATDVATTMRIPGKAATLPWPDQGSAELMIEGLGRLGGSKGGKPAAIGSVAKVMTAYVILENHPLSGDEEGPTLTVTAADVADYQSRIASGQSLVPVSAGEKLTERDALEALLLPSANNVAHMLAVWDGGSEAAFVTKMNAAADELGMTNTRYTDPSGFLPTTTSTAADQVILARAALKFDVFADIVALEKATIPVAGTIKNYNDLLGEKGVFGIKTGSTTQAGGNLLFAARLTVGGRSLVIVGAVFNQPGAHTPQQLAKVNTEVRRLLNAVRGMVKEYTLLEAKPVGTVTTAWGASTTVSPAGPLKVVGWPGLAVPVKVTTSAPGAEVTGGQVVGEVQASGVRVKLATNAATAPPSFWWKLTRSP